MQTDLATLFSRTEQSEQVTGPFELRVEDCHVKDVPLQNSRLSEELKSTLKQLVMNELTKLV